MDVPCPSLENQIDSRLLKKEQSPLLCKQQKQKKKKTIRAPWKENTVSSQRGTQDNKRKSCVSLAD